MEDFGGDGFAGVFEGDGVAFVAGFADGHLDGDLAEEGDAEALGFMLAAAFAKDGVALAIAGAEEVAHVFNDAEDWDVDLLEHGDGLARVDEGDLLRSGDDDGSIERDGLHDGELDVASAGREIEDEVVEMVPGALAQELLDVARGDGAADDDGAVVIEQEAHADKLQAVALDGDDLLLFVLEGALVAAEHVGDAGPVEIAVAEADLGSGLAQSDGEVGSDGALADAAFARSHGDDALHAGDAGSGQFVGKSRGGVWRLFDVEVQLCLSDTGDLV